MILSFPLNNRANQGQKSKRIRNYLWDFGQLDISCRKTWVILTHLANRRLGDILAGAIFQGDA
jgi:hypothetical protein